MHRRILSYVALFIVAVIFTTLFHPLESLSIYAQSGCRTFQETGKTVCGRFLEYWTQNGGLAQQGLPLTNEFTEVSDLNGKSYTVQYFERSVFEKHPENQPPYDVLLSQLGTFQFQRKYPNGDPWIAGGQPAPAPLPPTATAVPAPRSDIIGQTLEFNGLFDKGKMRGTVTDVKEVQTIPGDDFYKGVTAKGKFVVVFMTVTNIGTDSTQVSKYSFRLRDIKGRKFDMADLDAEWAAKATYKRSMYYEDIQPGLSEQSVFVFDVAPDATGYSLVTQ